MQTATLHIILDAALIHMHFPYRIWLQTGVVHVDLDGLELIANKTSMIVSPIPVWMVEPVRWVNEANPVMVVSIQIVSQYFQFL